MGFSDTAIARLLASGELERRRPGVFVLVSASRTWEQDLLAACRWAGEGAAASHRSAARLLHLEGSSSDIVELTVPGRAKKAPRGIVLHRAAAGLPAPIRTVNGIPATDVCRTIFDLPAVVGDLEVEIALDDALRRGLTSVPRLQRRLVEQGSNGRRGIAMLRVLIAERAAGDPSSQGGFNVRLRRLFRGCSYLPMPLAEYRVVEGGVFLGRVDFAYPHVKLAIEGESRKHHTGAWLARSCDRRNGLIAAGWEVLQATWRDVENGGNDLLPHVAAVLARREAQFA